MQRIRNPMDINDDLCFIVGQHQGAEFGVTSCHKKPVRLFRTELAPVKSVARAANRSKKAAAAAAAAVLEAVRMYDGAEI